jgi:DNA-binding winged helix-turn-helix (wHTH) protein
VIHFPPFRVDFDEERAWRGRAELAIRRKPFAILRYLAAHPKRLVTHEELHAHVWGGTKVSESALRSHLHELRQVLGEGVVETVIGRGYRFVAELAPEEAPEAVPVEDPAPRMVGRDRELAALRDALARADAGRRQIVFVTGQPGIGKTTLVEAFLAARADDVLVGRGQCVEQYSAPEPHLALIGLLRELRATRHGDDVLGALMRHAPTVLVNVPQLAPDDRHDELARRAQHGSDAKVMRELIDALEAIAQHRTLVVVLEDMQWSDVATIDVLAALAQRTERARLLVVVTARSADVQVPTHLLNRVMRTLLARSSWASSIELDRISGVAIERYLDLRFPGHGFAPAFASIVDRLTGGVPLFVTTVLDDLAAREMVVPRDRGWALVASLDDVAAHRADGVRALIDVQLDRLTMTEQRVFEAASAIAIEFPVGLVAAALETTAEEIDDLCDGLARRGLFLSRDGSEEWPDGSLQIRYRFSHGLVQEVAAARSAPARRQRWHRAIAARLEAAWGTRASEVAHALALHHDRGGAHALAVSHYLVAAERDARRFATANAIALWRRARELLARVPAGTARDRDALRVLQGLATAVIRSSSETQRDSLAMFDEMTELAQRIDDKPALITALANVVMRLCTLSEYRRAGAVMAQVDQLLGANPVPEDLRAFVEVARGLWLYWSGDLAGALPVLEGAAARRGAIDGPKFGLVSPTDQATIMHIYLGYLRWLVGDDAGFRADALAVVREARRTGDPYGVGIALGALARMHMILGDPIEQIRGAAEEVLATAGAEPVIPVAQVMLGCARRREAPLDAATVDAMLSAFRTRTEMYPMGKTVLALLVVDALRGARANELRALELVDEMIAFARAQDERLGEAELVRTRGELIEPDDVDRARADYAEAVRIAAAAGAIGSQRRAAARLAGLTP